AAAGLALVVVLALVRVRDAAVVQRRRIVERAQLLVERARQGRHQVSGSYNKASALGSIRVAARETLARKRLVRVALGAWMDDMSGVCTARCDAASDARAPEAVRTAAADQKR
ncbi:jg5670, partial [Pararge aegeria aegeria]